MWTSRRRPLDRLSGWEGRASPPSTGALLAGDLEVAFAPLGPRSETADGVTIRTRGSSSSPPFRALVLVICARHRAASCCPRSTAHAAPIGRGFRGRAGPAIAYEHLHARRSPRVTSTVRPVADLGRCLVMPSGRGDHPSVLASRSRHSSTTTPRPYAVTLLVRPPRLERGAQTALDPPRAAHRHPAQLSLLGRASAAPPGDRSSAAPSRPLQHGVVQVRGHLARSWSDALRALLGQRANEPHYTGANITPTPRPREHGHHHVAGRRERARSL